MTIRSHKISSFLSPSAGINTDPCTLFYSNTAYVLYDSHNRLMWRSDNIPMSAMVSGSRHELLKNLAEEAQRYDYGVEILTPTIYDALSPERRMSVVDPSTADAVYPDLVWLANAERGESYDPAL